MDDRSHDDAVRVPLERIERQIAAVLAAWAAEPDVVATTVAAMAYCDRAGIDSHGISMLMMYEEGWANGKIHVRARPRVVRETPVTALVDAGAGLGHPAAVFAMELAVRKARAAGIGAVASRTRTTSGPPATTPSSPRGPGSSASSRAPPATTR